MNEVLEISLIILLIIGLSSLAFGGILYLRDRWRKGFVKKYIVPSVIFSIWLVSVALVTANLGYFIGSSEAYTNIFFDKVKWCRTENIKYAVYFCNGSFEIYSGISKDPWGLHVWTKCGNKTFGYIKGAYLKYYCYYDKNEDRINCELLPGIDI